MLMGRTSRLAVEVLVELTEQGSQEWMKAAELGRQIDAEVPFLKQVLNRLTRAASFEQDREVADTNLYTVRRRCP